MINVSPLNFKRSLRNALVGDLVTPTTHEAHESSSAINRQINSTQLYILILLTSLLTPIAISFLNLDLFLPAAVALGLGGTLLFDIYRLTFARNPVLSPAVPLLMAFPLILILISNGYDHGIFLLYPLLASLPGVIRTNLGVLMGLFCLLALSPMIYLRYEQVIAIIIVVSMGQTLLVSWWLMNLVNRRGIEHVKLIMRDPLTQAYNRRHLELELLNAHNRFLNTDKLSTLILFDVDNFKKVNDKLGHPEGDAALRELVKLIKSKIRRTDSLCRLGGDEFALLITDPVDNIGPRIAEKLREAVSSASIISDYQVTISAGVCDNKGTKNAMHWFQKTDECLYRAKRGGRNRIEVP